MDQFLAAQAVWNRETARDPAYLSHFCGRDPREPDRVQLVFFWRSRADYARWMAREHDRIAELAGAAAYYDSLTVRLLDSVEGGET